MKNIKNLIKKSVAVFLVFGLFSFFAVLAVESDSDFSLEVPDGFVEARIGDSKAEIAEIIGINEDVIEDYFTANKLIYFAVDNKNSTQIKISRYKDDFSEKTEDFLYFGDETLEKLSDDIFSGAKATAVTLGENKFLKCTERSSDSGGSYVAVSYATVIGGQNYYISVLSGGESEPAIADSVVESFGVERENVSSDKTLADILTLVGIIFFSLLAVTVAVTLVISKIKSEKEKDNSEEKSKSKENLSEDSGLSE